MENLTETPQFALAVLCVYDRYVLQLRDDVAGIAAPGMWALFGGRIEAQENPAEALVREIREELCIELRTYRHWRTVEAHHEFLGCMARYWIFEADIVDCWGKHELREGQDVKDFGFAELKGLEIPRLIRQLLQQHYRARISMNHPETTR